MPKTTAVKKARRRVKILPIDLSSEEQPDNYPTLVKWLEANHKVRHLTAAQQYKARSLYIRGKPLAEISQLTEMEPSVIERLATINAWDEERDKRLLQSFTRVQKLGSALAPNVDQRHDRIAGTIETVAERILHQHQNGVSDLAVADLKRIADILKTTSEIRRTIRGQKVSKSESEHRHILEMPSVQEADKLALALTGCLNDGREEIKKTRSRQQMTVHIGETIGTDEEFEQ